MPRSSQTTKPLSPNVVGQYLYEGDQVEVFVDEAGKIAARLADGTRIPPLPVVFEGRRVR